MVAKTINPETNCPVCAGADRPECGHDGTTHSAGEIGGTSPGSAWWCTACGALMIMRDSFHCDECKEGMPEDGKWQYPGLCSLHRHWRM